MLLVTGPSAGFHTVGYTEPWAFGIAERPRLSFRRSTDTVQAIHLHGAHTPCREPTDRSVRIIDEVDVRGDRPAWAFSIARSPSPGSPLRLAQSARAEQRAAPEVPARRPGPHGAALTCSTT